ncbi:ADP-ribosyl-(dinitrogen reductase) hydrolase [Alcaligenaceae bacterium B3P038]|nr:ADP-ribosyl-(dinitrogen reductase) hydrolase [Alcaligenaceae bacterium B3P038]
MELLISQSVRIKLANKQPPVSEEDIRQCFANKNGKTLLDTREKNVSTPPTRWFIAETDLGLRLKVCYIPNAPDGVIIRSAYAPNADESRIYTKYGEFK